MKNTFTTHFQMGEQQFQVYDFTLSCVFFLARFDLCRVCVSPFFRIHFVCFRNHEMNQINRYISIKCIVCVFLCVLCLVDVIHFQLNCTLFLYTTSLELSLRCVLM